MTGGTSHSQSKGLGRQQGGSTSTAVDYGQTPNVRPGQWASTGSRMATHPSTESSGLPGEEEIGDFRLSRSFTATSPSEVTGTIGRKRNRPVSDAQPSGSAPSFSRKKQDSSHLSSSSPCLLPSLPLCAVSHVDDREKGHMLHVDVEKEDTAAAGCVAGGRRFNAYEPGGQSLAILPKNLKEAQASLKPASIGPKMSRSSSGKDTYSVKKSEKRPKATLGDDRSPTSQSPLTVSSHTGLQPILIQNPADKRIQESQKKGRTQTPLKVRELGRARGKSLKVSKKPESMPRSKGTSGVSTAVAVGGAPGRSFKTGTKRKGAPDSDVAIDVSEKSDKGRRLAQLSRSNQELGSEHGGGVRDIDISQKAGRACIKPSMPLDAQAAESQSTFSSREMSSLVKLDESRETVNINSQNLENILRANSMGLLGRRDDSEWMRHPAQTQASGINLQVRGAGKSPHAAQRSAPHGMDYRMGRTDLGGGTEAGMGYVIPISGASTMPREAIGSPTLPFFPASSSAPTVTVPATGLHSNVAAADPQAQQMYLQSMYARQQLQRQFLQQQIFQHQSHQSEGSEAHSTRRHSAEAVRALMRGSGGGAGPADFSYTGRAPRPATSFPMRLPEEMLSHSQYPQVALSRGETGIDPERDYGHSSLLMRGISSRPPPGSETSGVEVPRLSPFNPLGAVTPQFPQRFIPPQAMFGQSMMFSYPGSAPAKRRERWTKEEHEKFLEGLEKFGRKWKKIQAHVKTKTAVQVRTHAYGYFAKLLRNVPEEEGLWEVAQIMSSMPSTALNATGGQNMSSLEASSETRSTQGNSEAEANARRGKTVLKQEPDCSIKSKSITGFGTMEREMGPCREGSHARVEAPPELDHTPSSPRSQVPLNPDNFGKVGISSPVTSATHGARESLAQTTRMTAPDTQLKAARVSHSCQTAAERKAIPHAPFPRDASTGTDSARRAIHLPPLKLLPRQKFNASALYHKGDGSSVRHEAAEQSSLEQAKAIRGAATRHPAFEEQKLQHAPTHVREVNGSARGVSDAGRNRSSSKDFGAPEAA